MKLVHVYFIFKNKPWSWSMFTSFLKIKVQLSLIFLDFFLSFFPQNLSPWIRIQIHEVK